MSTCMSRALKCSSKPEGPWVEEMAMDALGDRHWCDHIK